MAPLPLVSVTPTPPGVRLALMPLMPMRRSVVVWPPAVTVSDLIANAPDRLPSPATVSVPLEMTTSCSALPLSNLTATAPPPTVMLLSTASPRVLTRTAAVALRLTPAKPLKAAEPLATSA